MIMPQNFKFVFLLFDYNVEKLQVRPVDNRIPKIYQSSKQRVEDICFFVNLRNYLTSLISFVIIKNFSLIIFRILSTKTARTCSIDSNKTVY